MIDPTRAELVAYLESRYKAVTCGETCHTEREADTDDHNGCPCRFDIEEAAYYLASHYHGGQWSNLYSALSTSPFKPGRLSTELPDDSGSTYTANDLYLEGADWIENK